MKVFSSSDINEIIIELNKGNTVAFGTDTVFGLACVIDNEIAINKIYLQKKRDNNKKLPMMFSSVEMMRKYVKLDKKSEKLIKHFSPGPITYILEELSSKNTLACRIPDDEWIIDLINKMNKPLFVTSANISGSDNLLRYEDVKNKLDVDVLVKKDARGKDASTVVDVVNGYSVLRKGPISIESIKKII